MYDSYKVLEDEGDVYLLLYVIRKIFDIFKGSLLKVFRFMLGNKNDYSKVKKVMFSVL